MTPHNEVPKIPAGNELLPAATTINERDSFTIGNEKAPVYGR